MKQSKNKLRAFCATGILGALGVVLMMLEISVPLMPGFLKLDFSELPALIAAFAFGPLSGVGVCLIKNLLHLPFSSTAAIGELSNFLLGAVFTASAGWVYLGRKNRKGALLACLIGSFSMAAIGVFINYFLVYPLYQKVLSLPIPAIISMYAAIFPKVSNLWQCLLLFNFPFTFIKGILDSLICFAVYKSLSPLLHGRQGKN